MRKITLALLALLLSAITAFAQFDYNKGAEAADTSKTAKPADTAKAPQPKTKDEYDAFKAAGAEADLAKAEDAANQFRTKYPDSEITFLLFQNLMRRYRAANNTDKSLAMAREVLALDKDNPEALVSTATILAETTRPTDLDSKEKYDEAVKSANRAIEVIPTNVRVPGTATPEQVTAYKNSLTVWAYSAIGAIDMAKEDWPSAEQTLRKATELTKSNPDPIMLYRLGLTLDKENKYSDALAAVTQAEQLAAGSPFAPQIHQEKQRLQQLTSSAQPTTPKQ